MNTTMIEQPEGLPNSIYKQLCNRLLEVRSELEYQLLHRNYAACVELEGELKGIQFTINIVKAHVQPANLVAEVIERSERYRLDTSSYKIRLIKAYRMLTNAGLKEAKDWVEANVPGEER